MFPSHWEILVIFLVVLLLFGAKRIPEMAKGLGKGIREFRTAVKDVQAEVDISGAADSRPSPTIPPAAPAGQVSRNETTETAPAAQTATTQAASDQAAAAPSEETR